MGQSDTKINKHGFPSFAQTVETADSWNALHAGLADIGLQYLKAGSGARVGLIGSEEDAKASAFGQKFSLKKLEARFGPYVPPKPIIKLPQEGPSRHTETISGHISEEDEKRTKARSFKMTLLRRIYTGLHLEDHIAAEILFVSMEIAESIIAPLEWCSAYDRARD